MFVMLSFMRWIEATRAKFFADAEIKKDGLFGTRLCTARAPGKMWVNAFHLIGTSKRARSQLATCEFTCHGYRYTLDTSVTDV